MSTNFTIFSIPKIPTFAKKDFDTYFIQADKVMLILLAIQWFFATFVSSLLYDTKMYGFISGALICTISFTTYYFFKGEIISRLVIAISMMLFSLVFIQQSYGQIEMHFHIFIAMAILSLYQDIRPIIAAAVTTILHHLIFNYLQYYEVSLFDMPVMVFNYGCGFDIVLLHGFFVTLEMFVLGYIIKLQIERSIHITSSRKKIQEVNEELSFSSFHDSLTKLPNRQYLLMQSENIFANANRHQTKCALIFLDLDYFKNINDTLGHDIGDILLQNVASRILSQIRENDLLVRIGGDEFILLISDLQKDSDSIIIVEKILEQFHQDWIIKEHKLRLSASLGVAIYPDDSNSIHELMKYADIAMYHAKELGRDHFHFYTDDLNTKIHNEVALLTDMHRAFDANEFKLYYQPKYDSKQKKIVGAEALIRWEHPTKGIISPAQFIPLAENTGFILKIGSFVINESIETIANLEKIGYKHLPIAINISTRQFQNLDFFNELQNAIEINSINPSNLTLEITESVMMAHTNKSITLLQKIKDLGVSISIDDFGTGYSSLSYINKFPIDSLKIDKSFIDEIDEKLGYNSTILNTIIAMAEQLNLDIVAEGIEKPYQLAYIQKYNCFIYQGFLFSRAINEKEFISLVARQNISS